MKKENRTFWAGVGVGYVISLLISFVLVIPIARYFFPTYITENEASKKCKELGGEFYIDYDYVSRTIPNNLVFTCEKKAERLFEIK